jgi:hypothetical protein
VAGRFPRKPALVLSHIATGHAPVPGVALAVLGYLAIHRGQLRTRERGKGWIELLRNGKAGLPDLLNATERRYKELGQTPPPAFFLYIDQGEELYVRAEEHERRRFSEMLAQALGDARLRALMSMRSDFLGALQGHELLFEVHRQINVPPLREPDLREVVSRPAKLLSARFNAQDFAP